MRKILILLLFPFLLFSQSFLISNIELPKTTIMNLDPYECDEDCLEDFLEEGFIFSFLSHSYYPINDSDLEKIRLEHLSYLNISSKINSSDIKIALLLPYKKIGRYAASTINASFAYLMSKNKPFELKSYKIETESFEDISKVLEEIEDDKFNYIVAPLTQSGAEVVSKINPQTHIYFPTINKKDLNTTSPYLYYGGIDYRAQSDMLLNEANYPLIIFHDNSQISQNLSDYQEAKFKDRDITYEDENIAKDTIHTEDINKTIVQFTIPKRRTNLEKQLKDNKEIIDGSFILNTPIIKSGMIMSQLTLYDTNATTILSTQTNYNPLLLSMTQYQDRKKMVIANSITQHKDVIIETNSLLGNDIVYDWINYTTTVGIDYFYSQLRDEKREYNINIENNQMIYPIELIKPSVYRFLPFRSAGK